MYKQRCCYGCKGTMYQSNSSDKDYINFVCSTCGSGDSEHIKGVRRDIIEGWVKVCDSGEGPTGITTWPVDASVKRLYKRECSCGESDCWISTGKTYDAFTNFKCRACGEEAGIWTTTIYLKTLSGEIEELPKSI